MSVALTPDYHHLSSAAKPFLVFGLGLADMAVEDVGLGVPCEIKVKQFFEVRLADFVSNDERNVPNDGLCATSYLKHTNSLKMITLKVHTTASYIQIVTLLRDTSLAPYKQAKASI